ncbi:ligase-associated DNA damage response endonuclease PdeM [Yoonia sp. 208BN28-4]|uniref:ligase-associated DNA damage response endonuclease PdeM n=1 Tax=Yoonia sp. 208BN28-4 TaxID=3126505 RepID=UPI00309634C9
MNAHVFKFAGVTLHALPSGALHIPDHAVLCVSDLHLGKSDRIARRSGTLIPPYENRETLDRLDQDIARTDPRVVICLGDSFDDLGAAHDLADENRITLARQQAGRTWIWIEGNHDPGPVDLGGTHRAEYAVGPVTFRHIATSQNAEVSGHYHPKFGLPGTGRKRACFVYDAARLMMPAYGAYTGGLDAQHPEVARHFAADAVAVVTGRTAIALPLCAAALPKRRRGSVG